MAVFILDTDTLSLYQRNHPAVLAAVSARVADVLALVTVTIEEQIGGWSKVARAARTPQQIEHAAQLLSAIAPTWGRFTLFPMTVAALGRFDQLSRAKLNVKGNDLRIAALALDHAATVVTRNRRDFGRVSGLLIEDWSV
ncbi:MAG: type II toxin-antitoxin system VapC family toxin [Fimbriiglobus sp.]|nr:type II toxin-antitoxin system VapC family toxin [Fimbriiglobus sp.]